MEKQNIAKVLDASGLACPLPLLKMKMALTEIEKGKLLKVIATDSGAERDFHAYCEMSAHDLVKFERDSENKLIFLIQKGES